LHVVTVEFLVERESSQKFESAMLRQAGDSLLLEPGCQQFDVCFSEDDPTIVFLYEIYDDATAFEKHLASEHYKQFHKKVSPWVKKKTVKFWSRESV